IVASALRLVDGFSAAVTRVVGDSIELVALTSTPPGRGAAVRAVYPVPLSSETTLASAILSGTPRWISDVLADPGVSAREREMARLRGHRSNLFVPMMRDARAIGSIGVTRREPGGFRKHQVDLLKTFADQA